MIQFRRASRDDIPLMQRWDAEPGIKATVPHDGIDWVAEFAPEATWHEPLIAEFDGRPVGFVDIQDIAADPDRYWGDVSPGVRAIDIWIGEPEMRGRGIGIAMMRQAIAICFASPDVTEIVIDPLASNERAIRFYRRLGFVEVERRWFGEDDCLVMRLERPLTR